MLAVTLTSQLGLSQEDYYYDSHEGYQQQQQQYYNRDYDQYQQKQLDRSYETNFKQNPRGSYYQQPYEVEEEEVNYPPQPFAYEYGGADSDGRHFAKTESKDEDGVVKGKYITFSTEDSRDLKCLIFIRRVQVVGLGGGRGGEPEM